MTPTQALRSSAVDLRRRIQEHEQLLAMAVEGHDFKADPGVCASLHCLHEKKLKEVIMETITVLEDTKRAFKSKQLEILRKKLISVLAERA